jgi:ribose 5-phosphate isomerase B
MSAGKFKVAVGCDPNATELKEVVKKFLVEEGYEYEDFGSDDPIYPNVAFKVGEAVAAGKFPRGVLICGTGIGMSIAANKVPGVYATILADAYSAERAIKSNKTNIATFGSQTMGTHLVKALLKIWLEAEWEPGSRSESKVQRIVDYAAVHCK